MRPRLPKSTIECPTCDKASGFAIKGEGFSRRNFLRIAGTGLVATYFADVLSPRLLKAATTSTGTPLLNTAKNCIFIFLSGAPSHVDTWDLKEGAWTPADFAPDTFAGGNIRFPTGLMPNTSKHIDKMAFVRSGLSWAAVHELGRAWAQIARNPGGATGSIAPHIGSVVSLEMQASRKPGDILPGFVSLFGVPAAGSGYLPASHAPFKVQASANGLTALAHPDGAARFGDRWSLLQSIDPDRSSGVLGKDSAAMADFYDQAKTLVDSPDVNSLFAFTPDEHARYGATGFGDSLVIARNLVGARRGTRFVQVTFGGWDHHQNIYAAANSIYSQMGVFDPAFSALIDDLAARPGSQSGKTLLDETLVVVLGEFGRTPGAPNNQGGRDHYLRMSVVMAGGGVKGGTVIGKTDSVGANATEFGWNANRDVRPEDVTSTIYSALGIDYTTVRHDDPLNRGFEYVPFAKEGTYKPVGELF